MNKNIFVIWVSLTVVSCENRAVLTDFLNVLSTCPVPEMECPNYNITFFLYTRTTQDSPYELDMTDLKTIKFAPFVYGRPVKILIHGYTGWKDYSPNLEIRPAFFSVGEYNIISLDYSPLVKYPCYPQGVLNTKLVGMCTANMIDALVKEARIPLEVIHVIGFSLGGQVAGTLSNYLTAGNLSRISGLDPALPGFIYGGNDRRLDKSDAMFVDVIHTDGLIRGYYAACGDVDFYPNRGMAQPGCEDSKNESESSCSHVRAPEYFAESIVTKVGFLATQCDDWSSYKNGLCEENDVIKMGEYVPKTSSGIYYLTTNSESPYAKGKNTRIKHSVRTETLYNSEHIVRPRTLYNSEHIVRPRTPNNSEQNVRRARTLFNSNHIVRSRTLYNSEHIVRPRTLYNSEHIVRPRTPYN